MSDVAKGETSSKTYAQSSAMSKWQEKYPCTCNVCQRLKEVAASPVDRPDEAMFLALEGGGGGRGM